MLEKNLYKKLLTFYLDIAQGHMNRVPNETRLLV